jgi:agmatine/peptidylarginine deiminase
MAIGGFGKMCRPPSCGVANAIAQFEPVILLADAEHHGALASGDFGSVELWDIPTDDLWARDAGPLFTRLEGGRSPSATFGSTAGATGRAITTTDGSRSGWRSGSTCL